jgi:hypothetical protein
MSGQRDTRRPDGQPETAKDKRFFDLRESGETRPIDHDGQVVEDLDRWIKDHS